ELKNPLTGSTLEEAVARQHAGRLSVLWCGRYLSSGQSEAVLAWVSESRRQAEEDVRQLKAAQEAELRHQAEIRRAAEKRRRNRVAMIAMLVIALLFAWLGFSAIRQRSVAEENARRAIGLTADAKEAMTIARRQQGFAEQNAAAASSSALRAKEQGE